MLFDLRGRGRRRTVQVVYATLALILGGGLVFLGVGTGNGQGGLLDAFKGDNQSTDATKQVDKQIDRAQAAAAASPKVAVRWSALARLQFQSASIGNGFDQSTSTYTSAGKTRLRAAGRSWDRYLALDPKKPDDQVASLMVQALGPTGTNQLTKAVTAQEIVTEARTDIPNAQRSNLFAQLAVLAFRARQTRKGDLAADRAVELAGKTDRKLLRQQLDQAKQAVAQQGAGAGAQSTTPQGASAAPPAPTPAPATTTP